MDNTIKRSVSSLPMSDLVGMWGAIWEGDHLMQSFYVIGKVSNDYFIVQVIGPLDGSPNIAHIVELKDMLSWTFYPTLEIANDCLSDYYKNRRNRFVSCIKTIKTDVIF